MEINNNYANTATNSNTATKQVGKNAETVQSANTAKSETITPAYAYEPSKVNEQRAEATYKPDMDKVNAMMKEADEKTKAFRDMVEKLIMQQTNKANLAQSLQGEEEMLIEIDEQTRLAAEEAISEEGYYGVEKTSARILDFAKAISGGDPSKIEALRGAVEKGFESAAKAFGKELPEISQKTYEAVMKGFDDWANEHKVATE